MRHFTPSLIITVAALLASLWWDGWQGLVICSLLIVMEVSFSFDNAVVNATVLRHMSATWQRRFLTWGMLISVFGMYYVFPIFIVAVASGLGFMDVMEMAIKAPHEYTRQLLTAHTKISAFGGMFLIMVFLQFLFDEGKKLHWLGRIERYLSRMGKLEAIEVIVGLLLLLTLQSILPEEERRQVMVAGVTGVVLHVAIRSFTALIGVERVGKTAHIYSGLMGFVYINILDASFSLDAVVGSFAISHDIVIIVLGLSAGAMFVRSLTVYLVRQGTLAQYVFLEHGAHYGIGALAIIMLTTIIHPVPEMITGLVGITFIVLSLISSVRYRRKQK